MKLTLAIAIYYELEWWTIDSNNRKIIDAVEIYFLGKAYQTSGLQYVTNSDSVHSQDV